VPPALIPRSLRRPSGQHPAVRRRDRIGYRAPPAAEGRKPPVTRIFPQTVSRVGKRSEPGMRAPPAAAEPRNEDAGPATRRPGARPDPSGPPGEDGVPAPRPAARTPL